MWLGVGIFFIGMVLFLWNDNLFEIGGSIKSDKIGQFGDFVGGIIGSLWALAGVVLFYVAIRDQRSDIDTNRKVLKTQVEALNKQIEEFGLQREELELTRQIFTEQRDTLKLQQFESTFFNLVNLHHQIVDDIDLDTTEGGVLWNPEPEKEIHLTSRDCFKYFYKEFNYIFNETKNNSDELEKIKSAYIKLYSKHQSDLGHYFMNLYNILNFINKKNPGDKIFYANLLRAQLSTPELLMLFYHCLSQIEKGSFTGLIEQYNFLENIPKDRLIDKQKHQKLYNEKAFGKPSINNNN